MGRCFSGVSDKGGCVLARDGVAYGDHLKVVCAVESGDGRSRWDEKTGNDDGARDAQLFEVHSVKHRAGATGAAVADRADHHVGERLGLTELSTAVALSGCTGDTTHRAFAGGGGTVCLACSHALPGRETGLHSITHIVEQSELCHFG